MTRQSDFIKAIGEKPLSVKRLAAHLLKAIKGWFAEFDWCKRTYNVKGCNVSNFDKTGFQIGVFTSDFSLECKAIYTADPNNRELVKAVATLNHGATKVPAMLISKKHITCVVIFKTSSKGIYFLGAQQLASQIGIWPSAYQSSLTVFAVLHALADIEF